MKNRLMILGSLGEFVQLVQMAKERNIYTIVCDGNEDGPAKACADKAYHIDVRDIDAVAKVCKEEQVDGIVTAFSDLLLECMVKIAAAADIPCYLTPKQLPWYRDKDVMKKMFQKLNIGTPRFTTLQKNFADAQLSEFHFPVVVKPVDKYGSRGIYVLNSIQEIREYYDDSCASSDRKEILVEEYHDGYEFNLMSWVKDGKLYILSIADREKTPVEGNSIPISTRNVYPSCLINQVYPEAKEILEKVLAETGQKDGELSMQFFWKPGEAIQVCEVAARFLGYEHELIEYCSGLSVEQLILDSVYDTKQLTEELEAHNPFFTTCSAVLYFQGREKVIKDLSGAKACMQQPFVKEGWLFYEEGEQIQEFVRPYAARCYIVGENREEIDKYTDQIFADMSMQGTDGEELLYRNERIEY
ncbi:MAG: ATP-grasp domain-containing protein [Lachnospiraceae bacterium]|nr:ATP-grasp domain-containing protein [Lachnospiraceae bacterium]MDD3616325.1 ATP-grasp domain-containing protein [Lachnospiraceae bacterium]